MSAENTFKIIVMTFFMAGYIFGCVDGRKPSCDVDTHNMRCMTYEELK
jgi:hypothetical protein